MIKRWVAALGLCMIGSRPARAEDWGMGQANAKLPTISIFGPLSTPAREIDSLAWFTIAVCTVIFVVVAGLLTYAIIRYRARPDDEPHEPAQVYGSTPIEFAWTTVPVLIVFALILVTTRTVFSVMDAPRPKDAVNVRVIGHQWWWELRYPDLGIVTANELHLPLSDPLKPTPTYITLESADVAHSFWVPRLAGKTDAIPNRRNEMWMDPHETGIFLGQCAEFCGTEHALMLIRVVVDTPEQWHRWVAAQQAAAALDSAAQRGRVVFESTACVSCHTVQGTGAHGRFGPDLTHLMSRETIAAGAALNTRDHLKTWVEDPDRIKPGALMPAMNLNASELDQVVAYLASLQ